MVITNWSRDPLDKKVQIQIVWADHALSRAPMTYMESEEDMLGKQGINVGPSDALLNDAIYEKALVFPMLIHRVSEVNPFVTGYIFCFLYCCSRCPLL